MWRRTSISFLFLTCFFFLSNSLIAGGFTHLPRSFGPFEVGMPAQEFSKLTGIKPEPCPICIKNEVFATLNADQLSKFDDTESGGDGADFFFFQDKLYHIAVGPEIRDLFLARQEYEIRLGGPGVVVNRGNGSAIVKWEDNGTVITLNYHPAGNEVFSVNYFDWNLKEERDWRESVALEKSIRSF